jgi:hypothetical protein
MTNEIDSILQRDVRRQVIPELGRGPFVLAYADHGFAGGWFCALVPDASVPLVMAAPAWDLHKGDGGFEIRSDETHGHTYVRLNGAHGVEPLVVVRSYDGIRPKELELSEEYRLFHNIFHDQSKGEWIRFAGDGTEIVVGRLVEGRLELRVRELRQYLAIRRMHLAVYFQSWRESPIALDQLPQDELAENRRDEDSCYDFGVLEESIRGRAGIKTFSKLIGKKLIRPLPLKSCGIWPYEDEKVFEKFIIGADEDGRDVEHSCDPDALANFFGANEGAPFYLTPVFFRREVLARYFAVPSKYKVEDGRLQCAALWSLKIDNNHPDRVIVMLGDLGRDLPEGERRHWRAHNVQPDGAGISEVNYRRNVLGEWFDAQAPDLVFKAAYERMNETWAVRLGWRLHSPLREDDAHCLGSLRGLIAEEQAEFDEQIKNLTKLLVDQLNDAAIQARLPSKIEKERGINKLGRLLDQEGVPNAKQHIDFLKALYDIRSMGAAHRKSSNYEKLWKRLGYEGRSLSSVFEEILVNATKMLDDLREWAELRPGNNK